MVSRAEIRDRVEGIVRENKMTCLALGLLATGGAIMGVGDLLGSVAAEAVGGFTAAAAPMAGMQGIREPFQQGPIAVDNHHG